MNNADTHPTHRNRLGAAAIALVALAVLLSACSSTASDEQTTQPSDTTAAQTSLSIPNQGGSLEGHTPRGFNGSGTGLFTGDELNPGFPTDDGVQIWLTFELPADINSIDSAIVRSDNLTVRGNPFETLGALQIAPVQFDTFGPAVVDLEPTGDTITCPTPIGSTFTCDVTAALHQAAAAQDTSAQFRLRFEQVSDPDGEQDMAMFFLSDSNTNEPGIFELQIN